MYYSWNRQWSLYRLSWWLSSRVQWFWLFFTFWGITTHPWQGSKDLEIGKKNCSTSSMACGNFLQKPENAFFWSSFKVPFKEPRLTDLYHFFSMFYLWNQYHTKFEVSRSNTVVTREWSRQGLKFICLQNLRSKFYLTKIFKKILFGHISHVLCSDNAF